VRGRELGSRRRVRGQPPSQADRHGANCARQRSCRLRRLLDVAFDTSIELIKLLNLSPQGRCIQLGIRCNKAANGKSHPLSEEAKVSISGESCYFREALDYFFVENDVDVV